MNADLFLKTELYIDSHFDFSSSFLKKQSRKTSQVFTNVLRVEKLN